MALRENLIKRTGHCAQNAKPVGATIRGYRQEKLSGVQHGNGLRKQTHLGVQPMALHGCYTISTVPLTPFKALGVNSQAMTFCSGIGSVY